MPFLPSHVTRPHPQDSSPHFSLVTAFGERGISPHEIEELLALEARSLSLVAVVPPQEEMKEESKVGRMSSEAVVPVRWLCDH